MERPAIDYVRIRRVLDGAERLVFRAIVCLLTQRSSPEIPNDGPTATKSGWPRSVKIDAAPARASLDLAPVHQLWIAAVIAVIFLIRLFGSQTAQRIFSRIVH